MSVELANLVRAYPYCYQANVCYNCCSQTPWKANKNNRWTREWVKTTKASARYREDSVFLSKLSPGSSNSIRIAGACDVHVIMGSAAAVWPGPESKFAGDGKSFGLLGSVFPVRAMRVRDMARRDGVNQVRNDDGPR